VAAVSKLFYFGYCSLVDVATVSKLDYVATLSISLCGALKGSNKSSIIEIPMGNGIKGMFDVRIKVQECLKEERVKGSSGLCGCCKRVNWFMWLLYALDFINIVLIG